MAADCANALFTGWIQCFGVRAVITSDRGAQFTSALWSSLCSLLNIHHIQTTAYHPQSNRLVERFYRPLKDALCARLAEADGLGYLPWVLLWICTANALEGRLSWWKRWWVASRPLVEEFLEKLHKVTLKVPRPVLHKNNPLISSLTSLCRASFC